MFCKILILSKVYDKTEEMRTNLWQKRLRVHRIFPNQFSNVRWALLHNWSFTHPIFCMLTLALGPLLKQLDLRLQLLCLLCTVGPVLFPLMGRKRFLSFHKELCYPPCLFLSTAFPLGSIRLSS